jgi:type IV secretion system protein VirB11
LDLEGTGAKRRIASSIPQSRASYTVPRALIAETIDLIAVLAGRGSARKLAELAAVKGLNPTGETSSAQQENPEP